MLLFKHARAFFFEIPSFEELQDPNSSPRREEVGRRTLGAYGGFLLSFFCRDRFQLLTHHFRTFSGDLTPDRLDSRSLRTLWEWKNRIALEEYYILDVVIPRFEEPRKKNTCML